MSDLIKVADLKPGMVIVQVTAQNGPVKIRKSGLVSSEAMVAGLAEMGVLEVQIDPAQTVEIDKPLYHRTQTQALIRGAHDRNTASFEQNLSEQFNRSLFLPTVQGIPSAWRRYLKQAGTLTAVILAGLAIGGGAGTFPRWWAMLTPSTPAIAVVSIENDGQQSQLGNQQKDVPEAEILSSESAVEGSKQPAVSPDVPADSPTEASQVVSSEAANSDNLKPESVSNDDAIEGEILNGPPKDNVDVSPELMARFNQAIEELDNAATDPAPQPQVRVRDDIPRVDQLPVRMLTRLPSMTFKAHMYASRPSDRWVRVNGQQLGEGDWIDDKVQIVAIEAQRVILRFEDEEFSMAALTDW